jgi:mannose-6-phosphate isomerase-like protein (cupin superfamily)
VPTIHGEDMYAGEPLPGWRGRWYHSARMTFSLYEIAADAVPLHEHRHPQEEVWNVVDGSIVITIDAVEHPLGPGDAAVVPPDALHGVRVLAPTRVVIADHPVRRQLPGVPDGAEVPDLGEVTT